MDLDKTSGEVLDKNKKKWSNTKFGLHGLVIGGLLGMIVTMVTIFSFNMFGTRPMNAKHIETVMTADRNCNDCHLGASFINLFNHSAVKSNDNVINSMMDKAHIKRW